MAAGKRPRIGLALGSGSARGWSHIGVIRALQEAGYTPDVVCGTSIGALVGGVYAAGHLDWLESWVNRLTWPGVVALLDFKMGGGLIEGTRLTQFFREHFEDKGIEALPLPFACVATELGTGRELWMREGSAIDAVRASIALPGLFTPAVWDDRLCVDGGLVNPVPVSLCRAMGAEVVIAVDLNWDLIGRRARSDRTEECALEGQDQPVLVDQDHASGADAGSTLSNWLARLLPTPPRRDSDAQNPPSMLEVLTTSLNIMQVRITQSRMAGEPADVLIRPRLSDISAMDFHRGSTAIAQGRHATELVLPQIAQSLGVR